MNDKARLDVVARLRISDYNLTNEAADEIERLRSELLAWENSAVRWDRYRVIENELTVARNRLGNAVGAIIDAGGYCTGPEDVTAAIGRLAAERNYWRECYIRSRRARVEGQ